MQRICQLVLFVAILAVGCGDRPRPRPAPVDPDKDVVVKDGTSKDGTPKKDGGKVLVPVTDRTGDEILAALPEPTRKELAEARTLRAIELMAEDKYEEALTELEEAQKLDDSGPIQREITKVQTVLAQREGAARAVSDVKSVLEDGKPEEAAKLAAEALGNYGGGDDAEELARLAQQAEAEVTAAAGNVAAREAKLKADAEAALKDDNLRAAAIALEQAQSIAPADEVGRRLDDLREKLRVYDESRAKAAALRRDPARLGEAVEHLETAAKVWPTLQVRQQIDHYRLAMERRRDRLTVAPFEIRADLGFPAAGEMISESLLPHFKRRFDLVERAQLSRLAEEMKLETSGLFETNAGRRELGELAKVRYMVVGSVSPVGGITVQARLVEVATGLIVQTARVSAPTVEDLEKNRLPQLAIMLQLNDDEKAAYEDRLAREVPVVAALPATPVTDIPPPPPLPEERVVVPPIVTVTAARIPMGGIVIEDFNRLPPPVFITALAPPPPPPPPLVVALEAQPERRNRMLSLSLMLGDNLFRRGRVQEAQRHFGIAFSLAGPRREISLRLDACRTAAPPPPPSIMVIPPRPVVIVRPPIGFPVAPPPPPVVIVAPVRPRLAVFGFVPGLPTLVPPGATDALADQLASYLGGSYEIIDRGEVCWYMGKLGMTMREVLNDPVARRCLAQSLNARYFVFGTLRATGSFDVDAHLFDAETNQRTATANMHVKDHNEMKLRLGELARQLGAKPEEKKAIAAAGAASEKALSDARGLLPKDPAGAAAVARAGLKASPDSVALRSLIAEADARVAQAKLRAQREAEMARQAAAVALAKKRQADLALAAAEAKAKAEAAAKVRGEAEKKALADHRSKAAESMRLQAKAALAKGDSAGAVKLLQSASSLQPRDDVFKELAAARAKADTDSKAKILAEQKTAAERTQKDRAAIQAKLDAAKARREAEAKGQTETKEGHDKAFSTSYLKQAQAAYDKKEFGKAMDLAQSVRRVLPSAEATDLYRKAEEALRLEKADATEKARHAEEQKKEALAKKKRQDYAEAVTKAQALVKAGKYPEAEAEYQNAGKLFNTAVVTEGLKAIAALRADQKKGADDAKKIKDAELTKVARVKTLTATAEGLSKKGDHAGAVKVYREALGLTPGDVNLLASLSKAEADLRRDKERDDRIAAARKGKAEALKLIAAGKAQMAVKKHDVAAELFRRALVQDATNAEAKSLLAQAEKLGSGGGKKADYELAMSAGKAALDKGNFKGAMNAYREALRLIPGDAEATKAFADAEARDKAAMAGEKTRAYDAAMKRGNALLAANKFKEARAEFDDALLAKPGDGPAIAGKKKAEAGLTPMPNPKKAAYDKALAAAQAAYKAGKYAEAEKLYDDALLAIPGDKAAIEGKTAAVTALREERYQTAMKSGNAMLAGRKWKEAKAFFEQALKLKPGDKAATAGKAKADDAEKPDPKKVAYAKAMAAAKAAHAADKYGEAVKHYNDALAAVPGDKAATDGKAAALKEATEAAYQGHLKNGQKLLAAKKYQEAEAAFEQALKLKPGDLAAIKGKREAEAAGKPPVNPKKVAYDRAMAEASAALKAGKNEDAKKAYERALAAMPDTKEAEAGLAEATKRVNAEAYVTVMKRGQALMTDKKFKEAEAAYEQALRLKPGDAAAIAGKKAAQAAQKPTEPPKKTAEFSREISQAQTLEKSGKLTEALTAYRNALKAVADDVGRKAEQARAYAGIGRIEHARKNFDEAVTAYEEALKRTPADATVKAALARAKKKM